jgi:MYXO-CTERM domain-containing protein
MHSKPLSLLLLGSWLLIVLGAASPQRASACSCATWWQVGLALPQPDMRAPRNTRVWVWAEGDYEVELLAAGNVSVEHEQSEITLENGPRERKLIVLSPKELLEPGRYQVRVRQPGEPRPRTFEEDSSFEVDDSIDDAAPPTPMLVGQSDQVNESSGDSCGEYRGINLSFRSEGILLAVRESQADALQSDPPSGRALDAVFSNGVSWGGPCDGPWPGPERFSVRFASFDHAGNFSGQSDVIELDRPEASGCSVSSGPRSEGGWLWLALPLALLARQRRRA